jgi:hypothetical protein
MKDEKVVLLIATNSRHVIQEVVACEDDTTALAIHLKLLGQYPQVAVVRTTDPAFYRVGSLYFKGSHNVWALE